MGYEYSRDSRCPGCGSEGTLYYEPTCVRGARHETTGGVACSMCHWYDLGATVADPRVEIGFRLHESISDLRRIDERHLDPVDWIRVQLALSLLEGVTLFDD